MNDATASQAFGLKLQLEIVWLLMTALVAYLVVYPLLDSFVQYGYLYSNILFVCIFITYTRYIFLLKHTFLAHLLWIKLGLIFINIPLIFHLIEHIQGFQTFLDNEGLNSTAKYFKSGLDLEYQQTLLAYMQRELIFFGTSSVVVSILLPLRMVLSIWRVYNKTGAV